MITAPDDFAQRVAEHLTLTGLTLLIASPLSISLGCFLWKRPTLRTFTLSFINLAQTIPSLALFAFLLPWMGIGQPPTLAALVLFAILPLLRNTLTALQECPRELIEAAEVFGFSPNKILWNVHLPQGLPLLLAGFRTAAVWTVGTATLGAFIGAGGLGVYIYQGIALQDTSLLLWGSLASATLAISMDLLLQNLEQRSWIWKNGLSSSSSSSS